MKKSEIHDEKELSHKNQRARSFNEMINEICRESNSLYFVKSNILSSSVHAANLCWPMECRCLTDKPVWI